MDERLKILRSRDLAGSQDMMSRSPFYLLFSEFRLFFLYCFPLNMFLSFCDAIDILSSKNEAPVLFTQIWIILSKRKKGCGNYSGPEAMSDALLVLSSAPTITHRSIE